MKKAHDNESAYTPENYPGVDFERAFIRLAVEEVSRQNLSHSEIARRALVDASCRTDSSAILKWRRVRVILHGADPGSGDEDILLSKRPHRLTLREAFVLCRALGLNISTLCFRAEQILMQEHSSKV